MLISCVVYQGGKKVAEIATHEIHEYLTRPNCFVWVALRDPEGSELAQMQREFGLHSLAVEDARVGHQRPKIEEYGDSLFAALHIVEPTESEFHIGQLAIFTGPQYVFSACAVMRREVFKRCARGANANRSCCDRGQAISSTRSWMQ